MSRDYRGKRVVIYPAYLDSSLSRREGRKVPLNLAVPNPRLEDIIKVATQLGLDPELEPDKVYPRNIFLKGRVVVKKVDSKTKTLKLIALELRKLYQK